MSARRVAGEHCTQRPRALREQSVVLKGSKALLSMNRPDGFDCPGCAWPDPNHTSSFEFCENGAKAVACRFRDFRVLRLHMNRRLIGQPIQPGLYSDTVSSETPRRSFSRSPEGLISGCQPDRSNICQTAKDPPYFLVPFLAFPSSDPSYRLPRREAGLHTIVRPSWASLSRAVQSKYRNLDVQNIAQTFSLGIVTSKTAPSAFCTASPGTDASSTS